MTLHVNGVPVDLEREEDHGWIRYTATVAGLRSWFKFETSAAQWALEQVARLLRKR
jgi:hypothetical protein